MPDASSLSVCLRQDDPIRLDVTFTCEPGELLALFGPSGSGKTTILRSIAGLYRPREARVVSGAEVWIDTATDAWMPPHRRRLGLVFQEYALFPHLSALRNVMAALGDRPSAARRAEAIHWLHLVHLDGLEQRGPAALSGGQRQRVALARALARNPKVLLLDEPFAALDRAVHRKLQDELDELRYRVRLPIILVTHDFDDVVRLATHVAVIDQGRLVAGGPLETLTSRPDLPWLHDTTGAGSVFEATARRVDAAHGLVELEFPGGMLLAPAQGLAAGTRVRVRIPAREVILASQRPTGLSLHNVLESRVSDLQQGASPDKVFVQVTSGEIRILAEVTRDAVSRLELVEGKSIFALIKSVSLDVRGLAASGTGLRADSI